ncbi:MAG: 23S rRNA (adenine(2030)-N(6))-methyltransferase RlmJ, partial [Treponema sp.]|nr:23S rRNA (adenine(2030)-N(6))-methyltransferase RlmJ [Treponema sp.]
RDMNVRDINVRNKKPALPDILFALSQGKCLRAELHTQAATHSPRGMYGSGLVVFNPPWTLHAACEEALPYLAKTLGGANGGWRLEQK